MSVSEDSIGKLTDPSLHSASLRMTGVFPNTSIPNHFVFGTSLRSALISTLTFRCLDFERRSIKCGKLMESRAGGTFIKQINHVWANCCSPQQIIQSTIQRFNNSTIQRFTLNLPDKVNHTTLRFRREIANAIFQFVHIGAGGGIGTGVHYLAVPG